jgi:chromosome segregation ATPase
MKLAKLSNNKVVDQKQLTIDNLNNIINSKDAEITNRQNIINNLNTSINSKTNEISNLNAIIKNKDIEINKYQLIINNLNIDIKNKNIELELTKTIDNLNNIINSKDAEIILHKNSILEFSKKLEKEQLLQQNLNKSISEKEQNIINITDEYENKIKDTKKAFKLTKSRSMPEVAPKTLLQQIEDYKTNLKLKQDIEDYKKIVSSINKQLDEKHLESVNKENIINKIKDKFTKLSSTYKDLWNRNEQLTKDYQQVSKGFEYLEYKFDILKTKLRPKDDKEEIIKIIKISNNNIKSLSDEFLNKIINKITQSGKKSTVTINNNIIDKLDQDYLNEYTLAKDLLYTKKDFNYNLSNLDNDILSLKVDLGGNIEENI